MLSPSCVFHMYCTDVIFFSSDKTRNIKLMYEVVLYGAFALHCFSFSSMTKTKTLVVLRAYHYSFNDICTYFSTTLLNFKRF